MSDIAYMRRNLAGLAVAGLWDYFKYKSPVKNFLYAAYGKTVYLIFVVFNITQIVEIYFVKDDFQLLAQNAGVTLVFAVMFFKSYTIIFRKKRIERLLEMIRKEEHRAFACSQDENDVYLESIEQNWFITRFFLFTCLTTIVFFNVARPAEYFALGPQKMYHYKIPMLFSSWFPFDEYSDENFKYAYGYQVIAGLIGAYYVGISDTFFVAFMIFAIGQFRMMQAAIRNLHQLNDDEEVFSNGDILDIYPKIIDIIEHHSRIIDFLEDLDDLIKPIMFMNFLICSFVICAVGLEGIIAGPSIRFALTIYFLMGLLIQLFLFYWHANEVTLESANISQSVCESEWFKFSARSKHALLMIIIRAQRPLVLYVGGFYPMSLNTFLMILRATYSYLALFRKMYSK